MVEIKKRWLTSVGGHTVEKCERNGGGACGTLEPPAWVRASVPARHL